MEPAKLIEYLGFTISVTALEARPGSWTAFCVLEKDGAVVFRAENAFPLPTRTAAEQRAIAVAKGIANGDLSGLP